MKDRQENIQQLPSSKCNLARLSIYDLKEMAVAVLLRVVFMTTMQVIARVRQKATSFGLEYTPEGPKNESGFKVDPENVADMFERCEKILDTVGEISDGG